MLLLLGLFALTARAQDRIITGYTATSGTAGVKTEENRTKKRAGSFGCFQLFSYICSQKQ